MPVSVKATEPIRVTNSEITNVDTKVIRATKSFPSERATKKALIQSYQSRVYHRNWKCTNTYLADRILTYFFTGLDSLAPGFRLALVRCAALVLEPELFLE